MVLLVALALAGCTGSGGDRLPENGVPANMTELKETLGVVQDPVYLPPLAKAQVNATATIVGAPVRFTSEGTSDPQGLPLSYAWEFGDGSTGEGSTTEHAYATPGEYVARLAVTNGKAPLADTAVVNLKVVAPNAAPVARLRIVDAAGADVASVERGIPVVFDATTSTDDAAFNVDLDLGDGTTSHETKVPHTYEKPGRFLARLKVTDGDGLSSTLDALVRVNARDEATGHAALTGDETQTASFLTAPGLTRVEATLTFDGSLGANDLTLILKDAGGREVGRAAGPTATGTQGAQARVLTLDAASLAPFAPGDWTAEVVRASVAPTGADWTLVIRQLY